MQPEVIDEETIESPPDETPEDDAGQPLADDAGDEGASLVEAGADTPAEGEPQEPEELVITIGDDEPQPENETRTLREMRARLREASQELRELKRAKAQEQQKPEDPVGPKPTIESCDWDAEAFESQLFAWTERKRADDDKKREAQRQQEQQQQEWAQRLAGYEKAKKALKVPDFEVAEDRVKDVLSDMQQAILMEAESTATLVYAIGNAPKRLAELAAITNPVKFAMAVARLETQVKTTPKKSYTPEAKVQSGNGGAMAGKANLEALREKARKTGDYTAYLAAKNRR